MFRTCPATGFMSCRFDKETHRCKCGRWQRGFKPKCEPVKLRGECQICEAKFALDDAGRLGHHGYKRPGCGFIIGDCMGVAHKPYTATDALEKYLAAIQDMLLRNQKALADLPNVPELAYHYQFYRSFKKPEQKVVTIKRGGSIQIQTQEGNSWPNRVDFAFVENARKWELENTIKNLEHEIDRVEKRIAAAK